MTDIKLLLKQAKRRQEIEPVCLRGDLASEYDELEKQLRALPKNTHLAGDPERLRIKTEMDRVRAEMQDGTVDFVLGALGDTPYQTLVDQHPPRRDGDEVDPFDAQVGFNRATFFQALIKACTIEPELDDGDWELLFTTGLSRGQAVQLRNKALRANGETVDIPFSPDDSNESPD